MRIPYKYQKFYYRYIRGHGGWICNINDDYPLGKEDAKLFIRDFLGNLGALFKRHKTYIKRDSYSLTISPLSGILGFVQTIYLPFYLLHELTHALAMWLELSISWIIMLPMLTEIPFFMVGIAGALLHSLSIWLTLLFLFVGMTGLMSINGDFLSWQYYKKANNTIPNLSTLTQTYQKSKG